MVSPRFGRCNLARGFVFYFSFSFLYYSIFFLFFPSIILLLFIIFYLFIIIIPFFGFWVSKTTPPKFVTKLHLAFACIGFVMALISSIIFCRYYLTQNTEKNNNIVFSSKPKSILKEVYQNNIAQGQIKNTYLGRRVFIL